MRDSRDQFLERIVREWACNQPVDVSVQTSVLGGSQLVCIVPKNPMSITVQLWVSDDGGHVACSIGGGSWWDRATPLDQALIFEVLNAVASGEAWEEVSRMGIFIVGRRGYIQLPASRLIYSKLFSFPFLKWQVEQHSPY